MENGHLIPVEQLCTHYDIEITFIDSLYEMELIEIVTVEENRYIDQDRIGDIEKLMRLHYDLDINMEGIDAISNLLQQINELQDEVSALRNRLSLYE